MDGGHMCGSPKELGDIQAGVTTLDGDHSGGDADKRDHPVREPPPRSAARKPKLGDWTTFGIGSRMQVPAPVRPRESIERLMAKGTPVVLPQLAQIHKHIVEHPG